MALELAPPGKEGSAIVDSFELRKRAKRVRYTTELVAPVLRRRDTRAVRSFIRLTTRIQDILGEHQDAIDTSREIEQVLARLDGVLDCAVIGVPDERLGEVGRAFLVTRPGSGLDEQAVIAHTREYLANFKAPRSVRFVDTLPRNAGGKVVKPLLRETP